MAERQSNDSYHVLLLLLLPLPWFAFNFEFDFNFNSIEQFIFCEHRPVNDDTFIISPFILYLNVWKIYSKNVPLSVSLRSIKIYWICIKYIFVRRVLTNWSLRSLVMESNSKNSVCISFGWADADATITSCRWCCWCCY